MFGKYYWIVSDPVSNRLRTGWVTTVLDDHFFVGSSSIDQGERINDLLKSVYKEVLLNRVEESGAVDLISENLEMRSNKLYGRKIKRSHQVDYIHRSGTFRIKFKYVFLDEVDKAGEGVLRS